MSSLDPPTYLTSIQNNIRARPISWEGAVRAKTITDADLKKIKSIDKVRKEQRKQTIESDVESFVTLLLGGDGSQSIFEAAAKRQDIIHYMLVLLGDMIDGSSPRENIGYARLLTTTRYPSTDQSPRPTPNALQTFPAAAESVGQQRGSSTTSHLVRPLRSVVLRCCAAFQENYPARRSSVAAVQLPLHTRKGVRCWSSGHCSARILSRTA